MRRDDDVGKFDQRVGGIAWFFIERIEPESAQPARRERFGQRMALDLVGLGDVDQERAGLDDRQFAPADEARGRGTARQMDAHEVRAGEQFFQGTISRLIFSFHLFGQARALAVNDAHTEREGAERKLSANLAQADDAELSLIERDHARDARPVAVRGVLALISRRFVTGGFQLVNADEIGVAGYLARQREHQHQTLLGGGNIGPASNREHFNVGARACGYVDIARGEAVFLREFERASGAHDLFGANRQFLDHGDSCAREMRLKLALSVHQNDFGWMDILRLRANLVAPTEKIRGVVLAEMREGREPLFRSVEIEDDLDQTQKTIVFDDEF